MISDILKSLGDMLVSNGYAFNYGRTTITNSSKLPIIELDVKNTSVAVFQTGSNINRMDFDLIVYREAPKLDDAIIANFAFLADYEATKRTLNQLFRVWTYTTAITIPGYCSYNWEYEVQGVVKEAQNLPCKVTKLNCSINYMDA